MRLLLVSLMVLGIAVQAYGQPQWWDNVKNKAREAGDFISGAAKGTRDMYRAYDDMKEANWKNSDKYFHARGNFEAQKHGAGGKWAAEVISNAREGIQGLLGSHHEDTAADQAANRWGRGGNDPNRYRPKGLPEEYKK